MQLSDAIVLNLITQLTTETLPSYVRWPIQAIKVQQPIYGRTD
jgi:hypothetical protein